MDLSKIEKLRKEKNRLYLGGGEKRIEKQHSIGKMTARQRLALLFDETTFQESNLFIKHRCTNFGMEKKEMPGEGVVTGVGMIDTRPVYAASQDFTVAGGSVGEANAKKIHQVMDNASKTRDTYVYSSDRG